MKTKSLNLWSVSLLAILLFNSCLNIRPKIIKPDPAFAKYISAYSSGMLSRKTRIRIELTYATSISEAEAALNFKKPNYLSIDSTSTTETQSAEVPDSNLLKNAFTFDPEIKGHAVWISDRIIEFIPDEPLASETFFNASFHLKKIRKVDNRFKTFHFQFSTYLQNLNVSIDGLRCYDNYNIEWQKLTGTLSTSDYANPTAILKTLTVKQDGKPLQIHYEVSSDSNNFSFYVDSIERKITAGQVQVSWDGKPIQCKTKGERDISIPALGDFSVTDVKLSDDVDQSIELTFSDPIDPVQNLKGLITLSDVDNISFSVEGNLVRVYIPTHIEGTKELLVSTGIKNFKGYKMISAYNQNLTFEPPRPLVRIKGNGCILPNSNGLIFPFEAISLKSVDVRVIKIFENNVHQFLQVNDLDEDDGLSRVGKIIARKTINLAAYKNINLKQWNTFIIDLNKLIRPDLGAIYRISIKFEKDYALCDCPPENTSDADQTETSTEEDDWNEDDWGYYGFHDGFETWSYYDDYSSPCSENYYDGKAVSRNILASDLGLIYKLDDNKLSHAFVTNMITAKPLPGVTVEYYDYSKQVIAFGKTDANGMLDVPLKQKPFLMLAKLGKQRGYLKLGDAHTNSLSKFDIEGETVQKGVKGFIYGERGVWSPGDSIYLFFIMEDKEKRLPPNHPVKLELQDPDGTVVYQTTKTKNVNGIYDFRTATASEAITGNYSAVVKVGNRIYTKALKIETVKPNRLKIYFDFDINKSKSDTAKLSVKWLHGAIAKNLHALVDVSISKSKTTFAQYKNYVFDSPLRDYSSNTAVIFDDNLNDQGEALLNTHLDVGQSAPGMLRATYITKVFEEGGDFSIDRYSVSYSPFKTYIGLHIPSAKNYDNTLETGNSYHFDVVSVDRKGNLVNSAKLQVKIYKIEWRWWYEKDGEDLAGYIGRTGTSVVKDSMITTSAGKASFRFGIKYPNYGRYLITVTDLTDGHQTGKVVYIDWPYYRRANRNENENASMLNFASDKAKYSCGENIKISFPSPSDGMALISIESGTKVIRKLWVPTQKGETFHEIKATADMSPNAYIHVTLLQPHASTKNDLPIRMYGVIPVMVDDPLTHLAPEIIMSDEVKPESHAYVKVREKNGKKMTYTLAMVDEGLLDLTRFQTPQPWYTFYAREALGVKTWDMYDYVIGAFAGKLDRLISVGGDSDGNAGAGLKANRFKPMVKIIGPFTLEAGQVKTHIIKIPNYVGSVKLMLVAENEGAYGNAEKTVAVKKPLMVLATLPRVLGPGENVFLPVDVFAMEKNIKDVQITIEVSDLLSIDGKNKQSLHFDRTGDEVLNFKLKTALEIGIAKVKITATSGSEKAYQEIEIDIRTPNPKVTDGLDVALEPGKEWTGEISFKGITGTNKATIEMSSIPSMALEKRLDYLIQYPYGCIEQTTSSVFPQLYVGNLIELNDKRKRQISDNIKLGLKRLQFFQTSNGGFSYWPGENMENEWGTNYAGHFIIEAENQGYSLPVNLKSKWIKYQQQQARNWSISARAYNETHGDETNEATQAYRLFVLALCYNPELGAMNRLREEKNLSASAKWRLAAAYVLIGQREVAMKLIEGLPTSVKPYKELSYSYGSDIRDKAMILESLSLLQERTKAWSLAKEIAATLSSDLGMNTQETAYSLLAMCEFSGVKDNKGGMNFSYLVKGENKKTIDFEEKNIKKTMCQLKYTDNNFERKAKTTIKNNGKTTLFIALIVEGIPLIGDKTAKAKDLKMEIKYKDMDGKEIQPDKMIQGTDFTAVVTISNPGTKGMLKEMVLNQIFPSGWEIHNARLDGTMQYNGARYQDIRNDRVYTYYDLNPYESKTFVIQLNATYLGRFYLPTVYSEAMYASTINARIPGRWVEVVKEIKGGIAKK